MHAHSLLGTHYHAPANKEILNTTSGVIIIIRNDFITNKFKTNTRWRMIWSNLPPHAGTKVAA